jgi:processive 1,2-diacylglycerol beta-glucosyltransferase
MKILALWEGMGGVEYHRLYSPLKYLQITHPELEVDFCTDINDKGTPNLTQYDLVVFNRYIGKRHYDVLVHLAKHNIPYVIDVDDYWRLPKFHHAYRWAKQNDLKGAVQDAIHYAAGVTTTTDTLANEVRQINPNVCVLPNALNLTDEHWLGEKTQSDKVRFGWVGGLTHANDIQIISDAIAHMCDTYPNEVEFYLCGYQPHHLWQSILYRFNGSADKVREQVKVSGAQQVNEYGLFYRLFDVALAPLEDIKWNNCKSELKVIEAAAYALPVIASYVKPYSTMEGNPGIMYAENTTESWVKAMTKSMDTLKAARGEANRIYCNTHHNFEAINLNRLEFYKSCISGTHAHS